MKNSPYEELAEDIIVTSGFAFSMWIAADKCGRKRLNIVMDGLDKLLTCDKSVAY